MRRVVPSADVLLVDFLDDVLRLDPSKPCDLLSSSGALLSPFVARVTSDLPGLLGRLNFVDRNGVVEEASSLFQGVVSLINKRSRHLTSATLRANRNFIAAGDDEALTSCHLITMSAKLPGQNIACALDFLEKVGLGDSPLTLFVQKSYVVQRQGMAVSFPDLTDLWEELQIRRPIDGVLVEVFCTLCNARGDWQYCNDLEDLDRIRAIAALGIPGLVSYIYNGLPNTERRAIRYCIPLLRATIPVQTTECIGRWPRLRTLKPKTGVHRSITVNVFRLHCPKMGKIQLSTAMLPDRSSGLHLDIDVLGSGTCGFKKSITVGAELPGQHCCVDFDLKMDIEYSTDCNSRARINDVITCDKLITIPRPNCGKCQHRSVVTENMKLCKLMRPLCLNLSSTAMGMEPPRIVSALIAPANSVGGSANLSGPLEAFTLNVEACASMSAERQMFAAFSFPVGFSHVAYHSSLEGGLFPSFSWQ